MRKIKRIGPVRPRRVVRELTPEEKAQDEALIADPLASRETLEGQLWRRFFLAKGGCAPEVKDFRDSLIAQGYHEHSANMEAWSEWLRMNDYEPTRMITNQRIREAPTLRKREPSMRKIKCIGPVRPRRVVRELTPEEKAQDEALIAETLASRGTPERQARWQFYLEEGCVPEVKEFRDSLIAQGYPKQVANTVAETEWLRMNGHKPTRQKDPYTEK